MLNAKDRRLYESYLDDRDDFSLISTTDAAARRDTKIARYKQENELKLKLEVGPLRLPPEVSQPNAYISFLTRSQWSFKEMTQR